MAAGSTPDIENSGQGAPPPIQPQQADAAPAPSPPAADPATGVGGAGPAAGGAIDQGAAKKQIPTNPVQPEYDHDKLQKAQTTLDIINAMKPKSRNEYMDWWQQQHGSINDHYDQLQQHLGARPDADQPLSRKEKFAFLLDFGIKLMQQSAQPQVNQGAPMASALGGALGDMQQNHQAGIDQQQKQYDADSQNIESARQSELKGIGTPLQAREQQTKEDQAGSAQLRDSASAYKDIEGTLESKPGAREPVTYASDKDGLVALTTDAQGRHVAERITTIDGKPFTGRVLGRSTGSGIDKGDTAQIRNQKYLTQVLGIDPDTATKVAFHAKTNDPQKDRQDIYKAVLTSTLGDTDKANHAADQWVLENYGSQALAPRTTQLVPKPPTAYNLDGLTHGMVRHFKDGSSWTRGIDGKPQRVQSAPPAVQ